MSAEAAADPAVAVIEAAQAAIAALTARARDGALDLRQALEAISSVRGLSAELDRAELPLLTAARDTGATWEQIALTAGFAGRQGAQKRHQDLARRASGQQSSPAADAAVGDPAHPVPAAAVPAAQDHAVLPAPGTVDDAERPRTLKHRTVKGLGREWTFTADSDGAAVLWRDRTTRAGGARLADVWKKKWEATGPDRTRLPLGPQPSRLAALQLAAGHFDRRRRETTPAGKDIPLPAAPGWVLRQSLAERDTKTYQVIRPGDLPVGTVHISYPGARSSWTALSGNPVGYQIRVTPTSSTDDAEVADSSGEDWKTRDAAAYAVIYDTLSCDDTGPGPLTPAQAVRQAAGTRSKPRSTADADPPGRSQQLPEPGSQAPDWAESVPLHGADGWILARTGYDISLGRWQTAAPDGTIAGTVASIGPAARGPRSWEAMAGDPARDGARRVRVSPGPDDIRSAPGGEWASRDTAALALAHHHDPRGTDSPERIALRAETDRQRRSAPRITAAVIEDRQYTLRKAVSHDTTGALDVLVRGRPAGSVRPASPGKGAARGWEPVDLAGTAVPVTATGRTAPGGRTATSDAAAVALLHAVKRRQDADRKQTAQDSARTSTEQE